MGAFILFVENEVGTQGSAPTAVEIESILRALPVNGNREFKLHAGLPGDAGFVGHARVTRVARIVNGRRVTRVAWLYQWPDPPGATPEQNARLYADVVRNVLANTATYLSNSGTGQGITLAGFLPYPTWAVTGWKTPVAVPYDPAANGTVEWWQSATGAMATPTRDTFDLNQQVGNLSTIDNPIGPTTQRAPDFDPFHTNDPNSSVNKAMRALELAAWIGGGAVAIYYLGPLIGSLVSMITPKSKQLARANPSRRRRSL